MYAYMRNEMNISQFMNNGLQADVIKSNGVFGCKFYDKQGAVIATEYYEGHSETHAENTAEDYVFGIKTIGIQ